jgi:hypothetical protein
VASNMDPAELNAEARLIVKACSIVQVGGHHTMAHADVMRQLDRFEDNPDMLCLALRILSGAVAGLAEAYAQEVLGHRSSPELEKAAVAFVCAAVDDLDLHVHRPGEESVVLIRRPPLPRRCAGASPNSRRPGGPAPASPAPLKWPRRP